MLDDQLLISELAQRAGVSVRTIRFYISEGLLPPPQARGRYSLYDEDYLTRIELIKLLKNAYLPLKEIKRMVESLSKEEIENMLHKLSEPTSTPPPASPQAPIPDNRSPLNQPGPSTSPSGVRESGLPEALNYISRVLHSQAAPAAKATPPASPAPMSPPAGQASRSPSMSRPKLFNEDAGVLADASAEQTEEAESTWRRFIIQPGVELLVSEQAYNLSASSIHRIVAQVKQLFSIHPSGGKNV